MQRAWTFRRILFPLAGVVCWAGIGSAVEFLTPPRPPADNDGIVLDDRIAAAPRPVTIEPLNPTAEIESPVEPQRLEESLALQPNSSIPFPPTRREREPITLPPAEPVPLVEPPLAVYPESLPPTIYAPGCAMGVAPTCAADMYAGEVYVESAPCDCNGPNGCDAPCACGTDDVCGCSCVPNWTIRAEMLIWQRAGGTNVPLIAAPVAVNSGDLINDWRIGPRLTAIKHGVFDSCWDLEVAYFGIDGWTGTRTVAGATSYLTNPTINFAAAPVALAYGSELQNFEVNGRRAYSDWVTWFVGFRALQVDELLTANINAGAGTHSVATRNRIYGGQLGIDALLLDCDCWYVNAVAKAGIYGNSAGQVTTTAGVGGALPLIAFDGNQTSFVGELGVNANYRLSDQWTLLAGYNLLWVNGLALAPDQLAATNIATGVGAVDVGGNLFYHGLNLGVQYGW